MKKFLLLFISMLLLTGCNQKNNTEENKNIETEKQAVILDNQVVNNLTMEDFNISTDSSNITYIYFDIVNNTEESININKITYTLYEDDREVFSKTDLVDGPIEAGDLRTIKTTIDLNLAGVNKVKYVIE